ncbi:MAG: hypothetical protein EOM54_02710 [Clostridia bacterium]|nr:hypothetical protein [Clostridia bacterium]
MTLYTSVTEPEKNPARKTALFYLAAALFCGFFSYVYEHFSHGVYSNYMVFLFMLPLWGGALPYGVVWLTGFRRFPGRIAGNLYNSGIATLTVGSCLCGILEIYGTSSAYTRLYWAGGGLLTLAGLAVYLFSLRRGS